MPFPTNLLNNNLSWDVHLWINMYFSETMTHVQQTCLECLIFLF